MRPETRTTCSECGTETTVPFKPTQGRPVLCRSCFQKKGSTHRHRKRPQRRIKRLLREAVAALANRPQQWDFYERFAKSTSPRKFGGEAGVAH